MLARNGTTLQNQIHKRLQQKYHFAFNDRRAITIDQLLIKRPNSLTIRTKDIFYLVFICQVLKQYYPIDEFNHRIFIQSHGIFYEFAPFIFKSEVPMMLITGTNAIFQLRMTRIRRIARGKTESDSSSMEVSMSLKVQSTIKFLEDNLSQISMSSLVDFSLTTQSSSSQQSIIQAISSLSEEEIDKYRTDTDSQEYSQEFILGEVRQQQISHLIISYFRQQQKTNQLVFQGIKTNKIGQKRTQRLKQYVRSILHSELRKLRLNTEKRQHIQPKKITVRQKALQMLLSMTHPSQTI